MTRIACIDIGTVTCRLAVADVRAGRVARLDKRSTICDLGEGLAATGRISAAARGRVRACVAEYVDAARAAGVPLACCTLTSAARDAANADELLDELAALGLAPQVIGGEVEGALTFAGVTSDFSGAAVLVADNGGGSTELACGFGPAARVAGSATGAGCAGTGGPLSTTSGAVRTASAAGAGGAGTGGPLSTTSGAVRTASPAVDAGIAAGGAPAAALTASGVMAVSAPSSPGADGAGMTGATGAGDAFPPAGGVGTGGPAVSSRADGAGVMASEAPTAAAGGAAAGLATGAGIAAGGPGSAESGAPSATRADGGMGLGGQLSTTGGAGSTAGAGGAAATASLATGGGIAAGNPSPSPAAGGALPSPAAADAGAPVAGGPAFVESVDVGCRRVTERFLSADGPDAPAALAAAHDFARALLAPACARALAALPAGARPTLVTCGGTVTSLVAVRDALVPYDPARVHLARLAAADVERLEARLAALDVAARARTPGLQPQRAGVIVGGIVCVAELLRAAGADELVVSEHDLLHGLALAAAAEADGDEPPVGWRPALAPLG